VHAVRAIGAQHLDRRNSSKDIWALFDCTTDQAVRRQSWPFRQGINRRSGNGA